MTVSSRVIEFYFSPCEVFCEKELHGRGNVICIVGIYLYIYYTYKLLSGILCGHLCGCLGVRPVSRHHNIRARRH